MKGVVFNLLEDVVVRNHGENIWEEVLEASGVSGAYTSLGSYPDEEIAKLVAAAANALGKSPNEVLRWFGSEAMAVLAKRYPAFFTPHSATAPFVLSVNSIIHPEVRKLYPEAQTPDFDFHYATDGALLVGYHSRRRMCALAEGFMEGAALHYGETARCEHLSCTQRGDPTCLLRVEFSRSV